MVFRDIIKKLLVQDRTRRLGNMKNGTNDVKGHKWFKDIDWDDVYKQKLKVGIFLNNEVACSQADWLFIERQLLSMIGFY